MQRNWQGAGRTIMWVLALFTALFSARYLFAPSLVLPAAVVEAARRWLGPGATRVNLAAGLQVFVPHPVLVRLHVGGGIMAIILGLFQFVGPLRDARPALHRGMGLGYLAAVWLSGAIGLPLAILSMGPYPAVIGPSFGMLSVAWLFTAVVAFRRARQQRFTGHRAWMIRNYSLTFAAATVRLAAPLFLLLTGDFLLALQLGICSWPLNLVVAEWLIRQKARPLASRRAAAAAS